MTFQLANGLEDRSHHGTWWVGGGDWYPVSILDERDPVSPYEIFGFVLLRTRPSHVTVTWNVDYSDSGSLATAMDYLDGLRPRRPVRLWFSKGGWSRELLPSPAAAIARMQGLEAYRHVEVAQQTSLQARGLQALADADPLIRDAFRRWRAERDPWGWADSRTGRHGLIFRPEAGEMRFTYVGPQSECRRLLGNSWRSRAVGSGCDDAFSDDSFNSRTSAAFYQAHESGQPIFDHVLAHIEIGDRAIWLPYQRVTLPTPDGVTVFTKITRNIDISLFGRAA